MHDKRTAARPTGKQFGLTPLRPVERPPHPAKQSKLGWIVAAGIGGFVLGRSSGDAVPVSPVAPLAEVAPRTGEGASAAAPDGEATMQPALSPSSRSQRRVSRVAEPVMVEAAPEPAAGYAYYRNCAAARAAGAAPIHAGEPGYSRKLDRDGDGVACE